MQASDVDVQPYGSFVTFSDPNGNTRALQQLLLDRRTFRQPRHGPASTAGQHAATADTSEPEGTTRPADADIYPNGDRCMNIQSGRPSNRRYGTERPVNAPNNRAPTRRYVCSESTIGLPSRRTELAYLCWLVEQVTELVCYTDLRWAGSGAGFEPLSRFFTMCRIWVSRCLVLELELDACRTVEWHYQC